MLGYCYSKKSVNFLKDRYIAACNKGSSIAIEETDLGFSN